MKSYHVYILTNRYHTVLYVGMTNDLGRRMAAHQSGQGSGFTGRYRVTKLVHVEPYGEVKQAIQREKQLKGWKRQRKLALIQRTNPELKDLAEGTVF